MRTSEICQSERRRERSRSSNLNGLDYLEVSEDQRTLTVYFLGKAPARISAANVRIEGGRRVRGLKVVEAEVNRVDDPELDDSMVVTLDQPGDYSTYTLQLENDPRNPEDHLLDGFDPRYARLDFSFKVACPSDLDCKAGRTCPPKERNEPEINYLAKDYASFRQLILDRLALIMPDWQERHVPDLGVTLVELLAYVGDYLSYYQDAVGTEAYLGTARQRISVRRHARLVDYLMHEGCNARAWVCVHISQGALNLKADEVYFITRFSDPLSTVGRALTAEDLRNVPAGQYEVFEPLLLGAESKLKFLEAHNTIPFYTWGDQECCLPRGATSATLRDDWADPAPSPQDPVQTGYGQHDKCDDPPPKDDHRKRARTLNLHIGGVLIFEEVIGPKTGNPADADPARRHAVRLTKVKIGIDALYDQPVVQIEWATDDALPFPFCLSTIGPPTECELLEDVSVARGNVVLVDHGRKVGPETLGPVLADRTDVFCKSECHPSEVTIVPKQFNPSLEGTPLTFGQPLPSDAPGAQVPASRLIVQDPRLALPQVWLEATPSGSFGRAWSPRRDLLGSGADDQHFVVEMNDEGRAHLRFGDGELGRRPEGGTVFKANYRIGHGPAGNVGPEAIAHVLRKPLADDITLTARNPLPARGGTAPEPVAEVKLYAPHTFRKQLQRAITADDYAQIVMREFPDAVQRAAAMLRWNGSWYEVHVAIDSKGTEEAPPVLFTTIESFLHRYRRIGHDLRIVAARYVPLDIELAVCVQPHYLRGHVKASLLEIFNSGLRSDGRPGFFHPDKLTFGEGIYLSRLVATAQAVTGVESVQVTKLERLFAGPDDEIENGVLPLGPLEVARIDNDPGNPENGILTIIVRGGR